MVKQDSPWWANEIRDAMKGYGLAVCIVLWALAFMWWYGGGWVTAKSEQERVNAVTLEALVQDWREFQKQVAQDHKEHALILRDITAVLERMDGTRPKNQPAGTGPIGES